MMKYEEMKQYQGKYSIVPICREIYADVITPISLLRKISRLDRNYYLLESVEGGRRWGRFSFLGFEPLLHAVCREGEVTVQSGALTKKLPGEPLSVLRELLSGYRAPHIEGMPPFTGGFVGYFSYEMIGLTEPKLKLKKSGFPEFDLMLFDKVIVYDHFRQKICVIVNVRLADGEEGYQAAKLTIDKMVHMICGAEAVAPEKTQPAPEFQTNVTKEEFCRMVEKTKRYIREGDIFQGVISRRFEARYEGNLLNMYRALRTTNPSPYMYYIRSGDVQIAGASPETMVKLENGKLTTFPVAGTRKRGKDEAEDLALEAELLGDEKELAEHNMLVDLARNDIGKIAEYGSVSVEEYMKIHRFSKVMHIASVVCGKIRSGKNAGDAANEYDTANAGGTADAGGATKSDGAAKSGGAANAGDAANAGKAADACDAVAALLPAGTLSGAPKFRACEIIGELEPDARGVYGGAIGYLDFSGNLDLCIAIRTAVKKDNTVYVQAGAGIVADSDPEKEYEETANKAGAVLEAFRLAQEVNEA